MSHWLHLLCGIKAYLSLFAPKPRVSLVVWCRFSSTVCTLPLISVTGSYSGSQLQFDHVWVIRFFFNLWDFRFNCLSPFRVTLKHSWTFSRTKLTLNSFQSTPTEQLMQVRIDEPLLLIRPSCSVGMRFWGDLLGCPRARLPGRWKILYLGYFSSCVMVPASQLPLLSLGSGSWGSGWWISNVSANACRL